MAMTMGQPFRNCYESAHNNSRCLWEIQAPKHVHKGWYYKSSEAQNDQLGRLILATENAAVGHPLFIIHAYY